MIDDSVGALHVALAAAVVGWLVFSISHSVAVWRKRNTLGEPREKSHALLYIGAPLCGVALVGGWLNRELTRRAGVVLGTDFFAVRARGRATPHLLAKDSVRQGDQLAAFDDSQDERDQVHLQGEIAVLEQEIAVERLKPLVLNPELLRLAQEANDAQRARLTQLGYGVTRMSRPTAATTRMSENDEVLAAQQARNKAASSQYERISSLVQQGVFAREQLDMASAAAQTASQDLREREHLIQATETGSRVVAQTENAIQQDRERAQAEQNAEIGELEARLSGLRSSLLQLRRDRTITAPFNGTVVYRYPAPALAGEGQVLLAVAKGDGFLATIQVPAREANMLKLGQELDMKLQNSLVHENVSGRLQSEQTVSGYPDRRVLSIERNLPPEQFTNLSSGGVRVTLQWRPPLYTDRFAQAGLACLPLSLLGWLSVRARNKARFRKHAGTLAALAQVHKQPEQSWSKEWAYSSKEEELYKLGVMLGEQLKQGAPSASVLQEVQTVLETKPVTSAYLVKTGLFETVSPGEQSLSTLPFAGSIADEVNRVLVQLGISPEEFSVKPS